MKRFRRRALGIALGLVLGWLAQGYLHDLAAAPSASPEAPAASSSVVVSQESVGEPVSKADHDGMKWAGAEHLVPVTMSHDWGCALALSVAGLFAAALLIGGPAQAMMGPSAGRG